MTRRKNPKPPSGWQLPKRKGGTAPLGSSQNTVRGPRGVRPQRRDPIEVWVEKNLEEILGPAGLSREDWTGKKLGEGSFGLVYQLKDGRVMKLGFDYSESWLLHNLPTFLSTATRNVESALPVLYYHADLSHLSGWALLLGSGHPTFAGKDRDASPFVLIRDDVQSLASTGIDAEVGAVLDEGASLVRTSMDVYEGALSAQGATRVPDLAEGVAHLERSLRGDLEVLDPIVEFLFNLTENWGIYLPDTRGANVGWTADDRLVIRDLGFVYAPQYLEWDVTKPRPLSDVWED